MKKVYRNKLIGSVVFVFLIAGFCLLAFSFAEARFISTKGHLNIDGVVASTGPLSLTVVTAGSSPITVEINSRTRFNSGLALGDLNPGDQVNITARAGSANPTARFIKKWGSGPGYGTAGDLAIVSHATVASKTSDTLTVDNGSSQVTFRILSSTTFLGNNFSALEAGDMVNVIGEDSGSEFVARTVFARR